MTMVMQNLTLFFVGALFLILSGINLQELIVDWTGKQVRIEYLIFAVAGVVLPFIVGLKTMHEISIIAIFGMLATVLVVIVIIIVSDLDAPKEKANHELINWTVRVPMSMLVAITSDTRF
jgi:hypothetical protein